MTKPTNPPHPGSVLVERFLRPNGMSPINLASRIRVPRTRIERIVSRKIRISADTALRLAKFFSTTPEYWMHLQCDWDLARAREKTDVSDIVPLDEMGDPKPPQPPVPKPANGAIFFGFDSAWANNQEGAICAIGITQDGQSSFHEPKPVYFDDALEYIRERQQEYACSLVAIDQPTIVKNKTGSRPVDRVAGSLIGYVGGGAQPANLSKAALFGEHSPFRQFLSRLGATEDPLAARAAEAGYYMIEVYPALALPSLNSPFAERLGGPKYNPEKKNFRHEDWVAVTGVVACLARQHEIEGLESWAESMGGIEKPTKADQDRLDAAICALVGYLWRSGRSGEVAMIGDLDSGYMITPISGDTRPRLEKAAHKNGVPLLAPD